MYNDDRGPFLPSVDAIILLFMKSMRQNNPFEPLTKDV